MIETAMWVGLGFLAASLIGVFVANAVWRRAVRLTTKRVREELPVSLVQVKADRDQLRAEFAMSAKKLEISVDELRRKAQAQVVEIGRKNEELRLVLAEVRQRAETIREMEARERGLRDELLKAEGVIAETQRALAGAERKLTDASVTLTERETELSGSQSLADGRRIEIAALQTNVARLDDQVTTLRRDLDVAESDRATKHVSLTKAEMALAEARSRIAELEARAGGAEATARAQGEEVGRLKAKLAEQAGELTGALEETGRVSSKLKALTDDRDRLDAELARRTAEAEVRAKSLLAELETSRADKAFLEGRLSAETAERERLQAKLTALETAAADAWDRERVENAMLRERIADVAAEITSMTATLEGANSPTEQLLAKVDASVRAEQALTQGAALLAGQPGGEGRQPSLADRVRALRARANAPA
jgi:chromosome segregation ATPase